MKEIDDNKYLFMATKGGMVKKTRMSEYANMRKTGPSGNSFKRRRRIDRS